MEIFQTRDGALLSGTDNCPFFPSSLEAQRHVGIQTGIYAEQICPIHKNAEKTACQFCSRELSQAVDQMLAGIADGLPIGAGIHARAAAHFAASLLSQ